MGHELGLEHCAKMDCHLHSVYSGHGSSSVAEMVDAAIEAGLKVIAFTEHLTLPGGMDPKWEDSMSPAEESAYRDDVERQRRLHPQIEILLGCEADWLGDEDYLIEATAGYDYVLGSVHFIEGWGLDNPDCMGGWSERGADEVWERYIGLWCDAASSRVPFDCMAHPDLPKKFAIMPSFALCDAYARMARVAAEHGRAVEVNTSGLRNPCKEAYPALDMLRAFRAEGVPCTYGSDAHCAAHVAYASNAARGLLEAAGYDKIWLPLNL